VSRTGPACDNAHDGRLLRPTPREQAEFVLADRATAETALRPIAGCEGYSEDADVPFDWIIDRVTGRDPSVTDYILEAPVRRSYRRREIHEKNVGSFR
jgi:hypothetical protein